MIRETCTHRQFAAVLPEEPVEETRVKRWSMPLINRNFGGAKFLNETGDEVENLMLTFTRDKVRELRAEKLPNIVRCDRIPASSRDLLP